jgi:sugar lactone lactonase YvrE
MACGSESPEIGDASEQASGAEHMDAEAPSAPDDGAAAERDAARQTTNDAGVRDASGTSDSGQARADAGARQDAGADGASSDAGADVPVATLFFLDITGGRVLRADPVARTSRAIVTRGTDSPDGVTVDVARGFVYWTNMGVPESDDGSLQRADLNGGNVTTIVPKAMTFTPKQLHFEADSGFLYWSDREGMRVMRARADGTGVETLVTTASGDAARADASNWAVGIAIDRAARKIYWTQKGSDNGHKGSIRRAGLDLPSGEDPAHRSDIEILFAGLPEPIDLELDATHHFIYWTDRGDNTVSRAPLDPPSGVAPEARTDRTILVRNAGEAIGIALDVAHDAMYYTSLEGTVSKAKLDGSGASALLRGQGSLTGITYVELPR